MAKAINHQIKNTAAMDIQEVGLLLSEQIQLLSGDDVTAIFNSVGSSVQIEYLGDSLWGVCE